ELLRKRFYRGGRVVPGTVCAAALADAGAAVAAPEALLASTFKVTLGLATENGAAGSARAAALAGTMLSAMDISRLRRLAMALTIVTVVGLAGGITASQLAVDQPKAIWPTSASIDVNPDVLRTQRRPERPTPQLARWTGRAFASPPDGSRLATLNSASILVW